MDLYPLTIRLPPRVKPLRSSSAACKRKPNVYLWQAETEKTGARHSPAAQGHGSGHSNLLAQQCLGVLRQLPGREPLDLAGEAVGETIVALDAVSAGIGDCVLVVQEGYSAMTSVGRTNAPIDASVIGIIDVIDVFDTGSGE